MFSSCWGTAKFLSDEMASWLAIPKNLDGISTGTVPTRGRSILGHRHRLNPV